MSIGHTGENSQGDEKKALRLGKRKGGEKKMDYKAVIEEQIRELQKLQFKVLASKIGTADTACNVANTIALLCRELVRYQ